MKGWRESQGGAPEPRARDEFTAYGQAVNGFVSRILEICARHRAKTFAALVSTSAPRAADPNMLRRDCAFLFQRFYYFLEDRSPTEMGLVVFDELEKAKSRILIQQMERYFLETEGGDQRSSWIVPEPFFVHSDLTTAVQLADIVAYCFNWGIRLNKMDEATRPEIEPFAELAFNMTTSANASMKRTARNGPCMEFSIWMTCGRNRSAKQIFKRQCRTCVPQSLQHK